MNQAVSTAAIDLDTDRPDLDQKAKFYTLIIAAIVISGLAFTIYSLFSDINSTIFTENDNWLPYLLLGIALFIALGFEFVNGFHDTANAVATVIYTYSLPPQLAVVLSGIFNFLGVLFSSGAVAFGIISLLPVELILQVGSHAGFAMIFALLIAAILWNLGTWFMGLPASSSHTLIGSIIGVGVANALMQGHNGTSGLDWAQLTKVGYSLLLSPLMGFVLAGVLLLILKALVKKPELYTAPQNHQAPPLGIRSLLILTSMGVSFVHGSNDGQKGMGLIMLILIGTLPMTYALNHNMSGNQLTQFVQIAQTTQQELQTIAPIKSPENPQAILTNYIKEHKINSDVFAALAAITGNLREEVKNYNQLSQIPPAAVTNIRNEMYLASETIRFLNKDPNVNLDKTIQINLKAFKDKIDEATKFIPLWVKVAVALALGLGTMMGWKRIVITVGEKIGKAHLTYAQGAAAELVAMATIGAADMYGLPVSTTHVLSSGVAGTMAANKSGLQMSTVRNLITAWVLTLPAAIILSGSLYWLFVTIF
jgi:PiT family inorganic phosphate transporter